MKRIGVRVLTIAALFLAGALAQGQPQPGLPLPRLDSVFPCGAKAGTNVEIAMTGTDLDEIETVLASHPGIKAEEIKTEAKADPKEKVDPKGSRKKRGLQSTGKFKVTVAADVPVGQYDFRVVNKWGISNPRAFCVGDLNEVVEKEPNNDVNEAQRVELNTTVNGVIGGSTDVDYCVFAAKKGQRVVVSCLTQSIDSRAKPMIEVFDLTNRRLAANRNYNGNDALTDFIAPEDGDFFVRLSEFTYTLANAQAPNQYFYRLSISTAPWIDAVFPPMVEPGKTAQVTLFGRNLPGGVLDPGALADTRPLEKLVVTINPPAEPLATQRLGIRSRIDPRMAGTDGFEYRIKGPAGTSNPILIAFANAKVVLEKENNDRPDSAEEIPVPCEVAGRIDKRQDRDWYAFNAKKGDILSIDLWSERMGVSADLFFSVRKDKAMSDLIEEDDNPDILNLQQFYNRSSDPKPYRFVAAEDGRYLIGVGCRESDFLYGPRVTYRLRVTPERPDYRLIIMPSSNYQPDCTVLHAEGNQYLDVFVYRYDGFNGPITLSAEGLPPGVTCPPTVVGTAAKQGTLVLTAAANAAPFNGAFSVKGTAAINGQPAIREARSATITWAAPQQQNNVPTVARLDQSLYLAVREKARFRVALDLDKAFVKMGEKLTVPLLVKQGDKLTVPFKVIRGAEAKTPITMQMLGTGGNIQQSSVIVGNGQPLPVVPPEKDDGTFVVEIKPNTPPGTYTVVLKATTPIQYTKGEKTSKKNQNAVIGTCTTPIVLKVLPLSVAKLTAGSKGNLKGGDKAEISVKVERQNEYLGEFKVKVVLPANAKGVTVSDVTIPAGKDEVIVPVSAAPDVAAGVLQNVVVQATAMLEGKVPIVHEAKFNLTVEKAPAPKKEEKPAPKKEEKPAPKKEEKKDDKKDKKDKK